VLKVGTGSSHLLGCVDRFDPEFCCPDAQHGEEGSCGFVVARGDAVKLFEGVDAAGVKIVLVGLAIGLVNRSGFAGGDFV
jgi:hypothetical protein